MEKNVIDTIKQINDTTTKRVGHKKSRSLRITGASCIGNSIIGIGKLLMGILMGGAATFLGVFMIQRIKRIQLEDRIKKRRMER